MTDKVKKGFYLATIGHCFECHTPMGTKGRDFENSYGKGGFEFPGRGASPFRATSPPTRKRALARGAMTRSGARSQRGCARTARRSNSNGLRFLRQHDDGDLDAVIAYLRTVPAKE